LKLSELFPVAPEIELSGQKYELIYGTRAVIMLNHDYPDTETMKSGERIKAIVSTMLDGIPAMDLVNFCFALLAHTKAFKDKDAFIDMLDVKKLDEYAAAALVAIMNAGITQEQADQLEVLAAQVKKKAMEEIIAQNIAFTDAAVGLAEKNISTQQRES